MKRLKRIISCALICLVFATGYPYLDGYMSFDQYEVDALEKNGPLLEAGAKYLITYQKQADSFDVTVEKTTGGKTTLVGFQKIYGTYKDSYWFRSLWLCGFPDKDGYLNAKLTDFKCYDSNGNNLGVCHAFEEPGDEIVIDVPKNCYIVGSFCNENIYIQNGKLVVPKMRARTAQSILVKIEVLGQ